MGLRSFPIPLSFVNSLTPGGGPVSIVAVLEFVLLSSSARAARVACAACCHSAPPLPFVNTSLVHIDPPPAFVPRRERTVCYGSIICPVTGIQTPTAACLSRGSSSRYHQASALDRSLAYLLRSRLGLPSYQGLPRLPICRLAASADGSAPRRRRRCSPQGFGSSIPFPDLLSSTYLSFSRTA